LPSSKSCISPSPKMVRAIFPTLLTRADGVSVLRSLQILQVSLLPSSLKRNLCFGGWGQSSSATILT
jgi:hypothetical protein